MLYAAFISLCSYIDIMPYQDPKRRLGSLAITTTSAWWQGTKEMVEKCFAKADFKRTKTMERGIATYDENDFEEINDTCQQL